MSQKAKKHASLAAITGAISGRLPETTCEVLGVTYHLRLLKPEAEDFVANNTPGTTVSAALLNSRKPTVAAALIGITPARQTDDLASDTVPKTPPAFIPIEQLFQLPDDMDVEVKESITSDPKRMRDWRREQILEWLREEQDVYVIDKLYDAYSTLIPKHKEAMKIVEGFSKRTP